MRELFIKFYTERRTRWFFRIWSVATASALASMLDGRYAYISHGQRQWVTVEGQPFEFYSFGIVMALVFLVSTAIGFFSHKRPAIKHSDTKDVK